MLVSLYYVCGIERINYKEIHLGNTEELHNFLQTTEKIEIECIPSGNNKSVRITDICDIDRAKIPTRRRTQKSMAITLNRHDCQGKIYELDWQER